MVQNSSEFDGERPTEPWADKVVEAGISLAAITAATIGVLAAQKCFQLSADVMYEAVRNGVANFMYPN